MIRILEVTRDYQMDIATISIVMYCVIHGIKY